MRYRAALDVQQALVEQRKQGHGTDTLFFVEHPHVVTMGRNGREQQFSHRQRFSSALESSFTKPTAAAM